MIETFLKKVKIIFTDRAILSRIGFVLVMFVVFRLLGSIPLPGIDTVQLSRFLANNQFFAFLSLFSGGGLTQLSLIALGVGPYITASIIMQLLTVLVPSIKSMYHEEGEQGRKKFNQYSRFLSVLMAFIQGIGLIALLSSQGVLLLPTLFSKALFVLSVVAGAMLVMWIGELISEFGIGNGISMIVFAGIVSSLPSSLSQGAFSYDAGTDDAEAMANNLQKNGAFVPNVRPGAPTAEYVATILSRTTFFGAVFFSIIAVMPFILQRMTGNALFAIGGTAILIAVSVSTDLIKKLSAQASMKEY
jgi:preprotein translocase subunit SecY